MPETLTAWVALALLRQRNHPLLARFGQNSEVKRIVIGLVIMAVARLMMTSSTIPFALINSIEAVVLIVLIQVAIESKSWIAGVLAWRPMVLLGGISYSLYLWQQLFLGDLVNRGGNSCRKAYCSHYCVPCSRTGF